MTLQKLETEDAAKRLAKEAETWAGLRREMEGRAETLTKHTDTLRDLRHAEALRLKGVELPDYEPVTGEALIEAERAGDLAEAFAELGVEAPGRSEEGRHV